MLGNNIIVIYETGIGVFMFDCSFVFATLEVMTTCRGQITKQKSEMPCDNLTLPNLASFLASSECLAETA